MKKTLALLLLLMASFSAEAQSYLYPTPWTGGNGSTGQCLVSNGTSPPSFAACGGIPSTIANNTVLGNTSGSSASPSALTTLPAGPLLLSMNLGTSQFQFNNWAAQVLEISQGTSVAPVTTNGPTVKISKTSSYSSGACGSNPVDDECDAALSAEAVGLAATIQQVAAIRASATSNATSTTSGDALGLSSVGVMTVNGGRIGTGAYLQGTRYGTSGLALGAEIRADNETSSNCATSYTGIGKCDGLWFTAQSLSGTPTNLSSAMHIGKINGSNGWAEGITIDNGAVVNYGINDQSSSATAFNAGSGHTNTLLGPGYTLDSSGNQTSLTVNPTSSTTPYNYNGGAVGRFAQDASSFWSMFWGEGAGSTTSNANITAMTKAMFSCFGQNTCGGAGTGMVNSGVNVENSAFGWSALSLCTTCTYDTSVGVGTMRNETTGSNNVAVGTDSMGQSIGMNESVGVGIGTLKYGAGTANTAVGFNAMNSTSQTTAQNNAAVGAFALNAMTTGAANTATGVNAMLLATTAQNNTALGDNALAALIGGQSNVAAGVNACDNATSGAGNICVGENAGTGISTGQYNIYIGQGAGSGTQTGQHNIVIGDNVDISSTGAFGFIDIGGVLFYNHNSTAAPAVVCGTGATVDSHANSKSGTVTCGTGTVTSATITFASAYSGWDHCRVTSQSADSSFGYTYTKSVISIAATSLTSRLYDYDCDGN